MKKTNTLKALSGDQAVVKLTHYGWPSVGYVQWVSMHGTSEQRPALMEGAVTCFRCLSESHIIIPCATLADNRLHLVVSSEAPENAWQN